MVKEEILGVIDVGSSKIRVLIAKLIPNDPDPHIVGIGEAEALGIRRGVIVDTEEATASISEAIERAERTAGVTLEHAYVSVGGSHIITEVSKGVIAVARADNEITEDDVNRVIEAASAISIPPNHEILHVIPRGFTVDNQHGVKDPIGMSGVRLEVEAVILEGSSSHIKSLVKCISRANVEIDDLIVSPLATSYAVLSKRQKELGTVLLDIGSGTTGMIAFEEGDVLRAAILPIGAEHVTNDLAIGLRTSIDVAEKVKLEYGCALAEKVDRKEEINLNQFDDTEEEVVSRKHAAEIIEARLAELFSLVNKELKKVDRSGKLPAGVVLCGGGAKTRGIVDLAKQELCLPGRIGILGKVGGGIDEIKDPAFATALGLIFWALGHAEGHKSSNVPGFSPVIDTVGKIKKWFKNFLP